MHYTGTDWQVVPRVTSNDLRSAWIDLSGKSFAVGDNGTILYLDGPLDPDSPNSVSSSRTTSGEALEMMFTQLGAASCCTMTEIGG